MLCDLQIFLGKVSHPEPPHAQSLFLFPIVFGINLIQFFDGKNNVGLGRMSWVFDHSSRGSRHLRDSEQRGRNFLARESVNSYRVRIFGKGKCKLIANFSATMVTWVSHIMPALISALNAPFEKKALNEHFSSVFEHYLRFVNRNGCKTPENLKRWLPAVKFCHFHLKFCAWSPFFFFFSSWKFITVIGETNVGQCCNEASA